MSEETKAIVVQSPHLMPAMSIGDAVNRYHRTVGFVKELMKDGIDYGAVPGTEKPTLLKPGAEKLTTFFGLTPAFETVKAVEDWSGADNSGEPFFYYWFRCKLHRGELLVAEADGSCNSRESRYRWRWVPEEDVPAGMDKAQLRTRKGSASEFSFAIDKAETGGKYGKPVEYWQAFRDAIANGTAKKVQRQTRAGRTYDAYEIDTTLYRVPNEDIFSQVNTIQKIGQKRALVAATLLAVNASEFFTQDLEDMDLADYIDAQYVVVTNGAAPSTAPAPEPQAEPAEEPQPTPGNGNMARLLVAVNQATSGYYNHPAHLLHALKQDLGADLVLPEADDRDGWNKLYAAAVAHTKKEAA
jgi:hypothetical protein